MGNADRHLLAVRKLTSSGLMNGQAVPSLLCTFGTVWPMPWHTLFCVRRYMALLIVGTPKDFYRRNLSRY